MSYDGAGNLSEKKLPDGTRLYAYDVFNRRIRKSVSQNSTTRVTRYGWDGERMCAEVKDGLTRTTIYEPGSHVPLLRIDQEEQSPDPVPNLDLAPGVQRLFAPPRPKPPARIAHYHTDHLGTPLMLTGPEGKVLWWASPDDWSAVRDEKGETDQPIRFQGQQLDEESGLHYNWHRYYDPSLGRYVTQDPIGLEGGINTYSYVRGNPVSATDPNGLWAQFAIGGVVGGIAGAIATSNTLGWSWNNAQAIAIGAGVGVGAAAGVAGAYSIGQGLLAYSSGALIGGTAGFLGNVSGQLAGGTSLSCEDWKQAGFQGFIGLVAGTAAGPAFGPLLVANPVVAAASLIGGTTLLLNSITSTGLGGFGYANVFK